MLYKKENIMQNMQLSYFLEKLSKKTHKSLRIIEFAIGIISVISIIVIARTSSLLSTIIFTILVNFILSLIWIFTNSVLINLNFNVDRLIKEIDKEIQKKLESKNHHLATNLLQDILIYFNSTLFKPHESEIFKYLNSSGKKKINIWIIENYIDLLPIRFIVENIDWNGNVSVNVLNHIQSELQNKDCKWTLIDILAVSNWYTKHSLFINEKLGVEITFETKRNNIIPKEYATWFFECIGSQKISELFPEIKKY